MTDQEALICARKNINVRINVMHPCYIRTALTEDSATKRFEG